MTNYSSNIKNDYFEYVTLYSCCKKKEIEDFINRISQKDAALVKSWNDRTDTQQILRHFLASKMILAASIMLTSEEYGERNNLKIIRPYLQYYALLSCARAVIHTDPYVDWGDDFLVMSHSKIINIASDIVRNIDNKIGTEFQYFMDIMRACREFYSYSFPANGLINELPSINETIEYCKFLCEVAQLQSAAMERAVSKYLNPELKIEDSILTLGFKYGNKQIQFVDSEDFYRLHYITIVR